MNPRPLETLLISMLFLAMAGPGHAQTGTISIQFSSPTAKQIVDSNLSIQVVVTSTYQINSVVATVLGRTITLTNNAGVFTGTLSLAGLPVGSTDTLSVTATDAYSTTQTATEPIIYDFPPAVEVVKPYEYAVGRPTLDVKAACAPSSGHCQLTLAIKSPLTFSPAVVGTYTDSVATAIDVSAYQGLGNVQLQVTGTDQYQQWTQVNRDFFTETSPYLTPVFTADDFIMAFSGNRVFVSDDGNSPRIVNIANDSVTYLPFAGNVPDYQPGYGGVFLTSPGAVFPGEDYNNGAIYPIGGTAGGTFKASSNYCIWGDANTYSFRNLVTKTTQVIASGSGTGGIYDVTDSGVAAYAHANSFGSSDSIVLYQNGNYTPVQIITDGSMLAQPLTDGKNVAYLNFDRFQNQSIYRYDAKTGTNTLLSSLGSSSQNPTINPGPNYLINNGYTAYRQPDASSQYQIWLMDTVGNTAQATFFSIGSQLETLGSNGQLAFTNSTVNTNGAQYLYDKNAGIVQFTGIAAGKPIYQHSGWYFLLGNTLFRVNLTMTPDKADSFSVIAKEDSLYTFSANDFASNYHTSGSLMKVTISKLPMHGSLKLNGVAVAVSQVIPRASLPKLVYTPAINFVGSDTLVWTGSNGFTTSSGSALAVIKVDSVIPTLPPVPQISGLHTGYCSNYGTQVNFSVTNMPIAGTGTTVAATLDGQPLAITAGGAMSIQPWTMTVGSHTVAVIFSNAVGADTARNVFQIVQASTPVVKIAPGRDTVTSSTQQVVLTATDVSGGGTAPLYTFSTDRSFNSNILQGPGSDTTMMITVSSLAYGDNFIYVRMQTSDSCSISPIGVDTVDLVRVADTLPSKPRISGLAGAYCHSAGAQQITISNMPSSGSGVAVTGTLDGQAISISSAGTITLQPQTLSVGVHTLAVSFTNTTGIDSTHALVQIDALLTPAVKLTTNLTLITAATTSIGLIATDVSSGGSTPLYTFARDPGFTNIVQAQGPADSAAVAVSTLAPGNNVFYVRMQTSDSCVSSNTAMDSVVIVLPADTAGQTLGGHVTVGPNPFTGNMTIRNLQTNRSYGVTLTNSSGQVLINQVVQGQTRVVLLTSDLLRGVYFLRVYDLGNGKTVRTAVLLSANR